MSGLWLPDECLYCDNVKTHLLSEIPFKNACFLTILSFNYFIKYGPLFLENQVYTILLCAFANLLIKQTCGFLLEILCIHTIFEKRREEKMKMNE